MASRPNRRVYLQPIDCVSRVRVGIGAWLQRVQTEFLQRTSTHFASRFSSATLRSVRRFARAALQDIFGRFFLQPLRPVHLCVQLLPTDHQRRPQQVQLLPLHLSLVFIRRLLVLLLLLVMIAVGTAEPAVEKTRRERV